jgi:hypothetical protein
MIPWMESQPPSDCGMFVGGIVVHDEMNIEFL